MLKKWTVLFLSSASLLVACQSPVYNQTEANSADVKIKMQKLRHQSDNDAKPQCPLVMKQGMYVDTTPISLERSPSWLENNIILRGDQLPFSYYSRTIAGGAGKGILTKYQTGLDSSVKISINYSGSIKGALDLIASKTGYVYNVRSNKVYWQAFVTKTLDVAFMPGSSDYLMGKSSGGGSSASTAAAGSAAGSVTLNTTTSDYSDSEYSNLSGKLSIWKDLEATLAQLLSPDGKVTVSQATTTVTVRDRPTNVELVAQYINNLNKNLSKQVLVKVQILEVSLQNGYNFGINWALVTKAFHNSSFVVNGNYGTPISITALTPQPGSQSTPQFGSQIQNMGIVPGYTILFNALNQQGKTSVVSEPRVVCLNNQVSVIRITTQVGYVASVQNTAVGGTSSTLSAAQNTVTSQVTPGTLITGLTLYILPKIMNNQVYMQVNADLSTNNGFTTFSGSNQIQLPNITEKHFNQRSMIRSGDTLILSGFRQVSNQANANQFLESQALGGKGANQVNTETIILITPFVLNGSA